MKKMMSKMGKKGSLKEVLSYLDKLYDKKKLEDQE